MANTQLLKNTLTAILNKVSKDNPIQNIEDAGTYTYIGLAAPSSATNSAVWQIKRIDTNGNVRFAGGVPTFTQVWDNRTSLSYS